ncbi:MAG: hypothetical protein V1738_05855 [Patescibacteria group bacterium]
MTKKRIDLLHQCLKAVSLTLIDAGLMQSKFVVGRYGLAEIEVDMADVDGHDESNRFVETVVMHLQRDCGLPAWPVRLADGENAGSRVHPWKLFVTNDDGGEDVLPFSISCRCNTSGKTFSVLHIVLG